MSVRIGRLALTAVMCAGLLAITACGGGSSADTAATKAPVREPQVDPAVEYCVDAWNRDAGRGVNALGFYASAYAGGARSVYINKARTGACVVALPLDPTSPNRGASVWAEVREGWLQLIAGGVSAVCSHCSTDPGGSGASERFIVALPYARKLEAYAADVAVASLHADGMLTAVAGVTPPPTPDEDLAEADSSAAPARVEDDAGASTSATSGDEDLETVTPKVDCHRVVYSNPYGSGSLEVFSSSAAACTEARNTVADAASHRGQFGDSTADGQTMKSGWVCFGGRMGDGYEWRCANEATHLVAEGRRA